MTGVSRLRPRRLVRRALDLHLWGSRTLVV